MLFVAEYEVGWEGLEATVAKRLEWQEEKPESFRFLGEWFWHAGDPPFRGVAVFEVESVEDVHGFVLHYGPTLRMHVHPATDVMTGIEILERAGAPEPAERASAPPPSGTRRRGRAADRAGD